MSIFTYMAVTVAGLIKEGTIKICAVCGAYFMRLSRTTSELQRR